MKQIIEVKIDKSIADDLRTLHGVNAVQEIIQSIHTDHPDCIPLITITDNKKVNNEN